MASISSDTPFLVEGEAILEARAAATLHEDAQFQVRIALLGDQIGHLGSSAVGEDDRGGHFGGGRGGFGYGAHGDTPKFSQLVRMLQQRAREFPGPTA
jgi:hypothetical protein